MSTSRTPERAELALEAWRRAWTRNANHKSQAGYKPRSNCTQFNSDLRLVELPAVLRLPWSPSVVRDIFGSCSRNLHLHE